MKASDLVWSFSNLDYRLYGAEMILQSGISQYGSGNVGGAVIFTTNNTPRLTIKNDGLVELGYI